jgi:hypothetical protein
MRKTLLGGAGISRRSGPLSSDSVPRTAIFGTLKSEESTSVATPLLIEWNYVRPGFSGAARIGRAG